MPRYFFHVRSSDDFIRDEEGGEFADVASARDEAEQSARGIMSECLMSGEVVDGQVFEVTDDKGDLVFTYPLRDAIRLP